MAINRAGKTRTSLRSGARHVAGRRPTGKQAGEAGTAVVAGSARKPSPVPRDDEPAGLEDQQASTAAVVEPAEQDSTAQENQDLAVEDSEHNEDLAPRRRRLRRGLRMLRPRRTRSLLALIIVSALLGTGLSLWFHAEADALRSTPQARNEALLDQTTTRQVTGQVTDSLEKLWSYHYQKLAQHDETVSQVATKTFLDSYQKQFDRIKKIAPKQQAVVSATVTEIAVRSLHDDRATLIAFLNQQATKKASGDKTKAASRLRVEATRNNGRWLISTVTPF